MKPETAEALARARRKLNDAKKMVEVELLAYHAARQSYVAALAAAHALIFELTGKYPNTHRGAKAMVHDLSRKGHAISAEALTILDTGFDWKSTADYGDERTITASDGREGVRLADLFIAQVAAILEKS